MLIRAARILHCKPWELEDVGDEWLTWALETEAAESSARSMQETRGGK